jgi:ComEC/Rec2-related protein
MAALLAAGAYMLLAGTTVPTQRAFVMIGLVLLAVLVDRTAISMRTVAFAAVLILLLALESVLGASFQMSFAAVVVIVAGYELLRDCIRRDGDRSQAHWSRGTVVYIGGVALTSVIAMAATAPFNAFHFNRLAGYGLIANISSPRRSPRSGSCPGAFWPWLCCPSGSKVSLWRPWDGKSRRSWRSPGPWRAGRGACFWCPASHPLLCS